jgi:hypothetical protein
VKLFIVLMWVFIVVGYGIAGVRLAHDDDHRPPVVTVLDEDPARGMVCRTTGVCRVEP